MEWRQALTNWIVGPLCRFTGVGHSRSWKVFNYSRFQSFLLFKSQCRRWPIRSPYENTLAHRSLTGGPRSGSGPKSRSTRTRTYSQNIRLWSKTWRGASISAGAAFVFTVVVAETHRPIACELSHHVIPLSQSSLVNIATRQSADRWKSSRLVTHEKTIER